MERIQVHAVEYHDQVLPHWLAAGTGLTLVHVDAHHDVDDAADGEVTIGSFISRAIREGIVSRMYWVVPDASWRFSKDRQNLLLQLQALTRGWGTGGHIRGGKQEYELDLGGVQVTTLPLSRLEEIREPAILDIDTDFLLTPRVSVSSPQGNCGPPWIWPKELVELLRRRVTAPRVTTIAYSVEGGFTPLMWRWLGDELAALLAHEPRDFEPLRATTLALATGDAAAARAGAARLGESSAAEIFGRALAAAAGGDHPAAVRDYEAAVAKDGSYRTAYATPGFRHLWSKQPADALACFQRALLLDRDDYFAQMGAAQALAAMEWHDQAEAAVRSLHARHPSLDSALLLADLAFENGRYSESAEAYGEALRRTLAGEHKIGEPIFSSVMQAGIRENSHFLLHLKRGRALRCAGKPRDARQALLMARAAEVGDPQVELELARLHAAEWSLLPATQQLLRGTGKLVRTGWWNSQRMLKKVARTLRIPLLRQQYAAAPRDAR